MICRVPGSSANIGPGFDSLGVALSVAVEIGVLGTEHALPTGAHAADDHHLATIAFRRLGGEGQLWERSAIPMGRGLGYSASVRLAGLLLACGQRGREPEETIVEFGEEALAHAISLEGHADNAGPALLGGVVATTGEHSIRVPLGFDPAIVVWVPSFTTRTDQSRNKLGPSVTLADAVFNIGHTAVLVAALAAGDVGALRHAVDDRVHQPVRFASSPMSRAAHDAALGAGAWCAWLSGSGPTVAAMCPIDAAASLAAALPADGHTKILRIDHGGAVLERDS